MTLFLDAPIISNLPMILEIVRNTRVKSISHRLIWQLVLTFSSSRYASHFLILLSSSPNRFPVLVDRYYLARGIMGSTLVKKGNLTQKFFLSFIGDRRSVRLQAVTLVPLTRPPTPNVEAGSHSPPSLSSTYHLSFVYLLRNIDIDFSCCYPFPF